MNYPSRPGEKGGKCQETEGMEFGKATQPMSSLGDWTTMATEPMLMGPLTADRAVAGPVATPEGISLAHFVPVTRGSRAGVNVLLVNAGTFQTLSGALRGEWAEISTPLIPR